MWSKRNDDIRYLLIITIAGKNDLASHIGTMSKAHETLAVGEYLNSSDQYY